MGRIADYLRSVDPTRPEYRDQLSASARLTSIDILRGLVIVVMGLDHTRDFFGVTSFAPEDPAQTTVAFFFTRWITHYCAPVFLFLTGIAAFLYGVKRGSRRDLTRFLLSRGMWLIAVEIVLINTSWQSYWAGFMFLQVIWAIGLSMIILAALIWVRPGWILAIALVSILGHNLLDGIPKQAFGDFSWWWLIFHQQGWIPTGPGRFGVFVIYPLLPWFGVMAAGYLLGPVFLKPADERRSILVRLGIGLTLAFFVLRFADFYGDPSSWQVQERGAAFTVLSFLNTTKYPPSLLFLLMTLGPAIWILPWLERWRGGTAKLLLVFGSVPFFYYVVHIPVLNLMAHGWNGYHYGFYGHLAYRANNPPAGYEANLVVVYGAWFLATFFLYFGCRWFSGVKKRHRTWWIRYL